MVYARRQNVEFVFPVYLYNCLFVLLYFWANVNHIFLWLQTFHASRSPRIAQALHTKKNVLIQISYIIHVHLHLFEYETDMTDDVFRM